MTDTPVNRPIAWVDFPSSQAPDAPRLKRCFGPAKAWLLAWQPDDVSEVLAQAHAQAQQGAWCVGWIAYEAASAWNPDLPVKSLGRQQPYAAWAVFDRAHPWPQFSPGHEPEHTWQLGPWQAGWSEPDIHRHIETILDWIRQGDVYQVNLTDRLSGPFQGNLQACFQALWRAQPEGYALMLDASAAGAGAVLSASPELFFDWHQGTLTTRPMKGTAPRAFDVEADLQARQHLASSAKERAENLMIVDLLRNDLSRVARTGTVTVPSLFDVQALPTVWQMTSTITASSREGATINDILSALFPCGSVTGAPKRQAMRRIAELEPTPRGVYCGASGIMQPGGQVTLNVPIRTVYIDTQAQPMAATCGIGSGITLDATGEGEAREWMAKRSFLARAAAPFQLLESFRLEDGVLARRDLHLARILRAASAFHFIDDTTRLRLAQNIDQELDRLCAEHPTGTFKARLLVDAHGQVQVEAAPLVTPESPLRVALASAPMPPADAFIWHKTTHRLAYARHAPPQGFFDTLLYNQAQELTEFTIGNLAIELDGQWLTPATHCGLLPGVMRQSLLAEGHLREAVIHLHDLPRATGLALINSVRGWVPVALQRP